MRSAFSPERAVGKFRDRFCPPYIDPLVDAVRFGDDESREPVSRQFPNRFLCFSRTWILSLLFCASVGESRETVCLRLRNSEPPIDPLSPEPVVSRPVLSPPNKELPAARRSGVGDLRFLRFCESICSDVSSLFGERPLPPYALALLDDAVVVDGRTGAPRSP